jgi:twitching motility protein PilT
MSSETTTISSPGRTRSRRIHGSDDVTEPPWELEVVDDQAADIGKPWLDDPSSGRLPTAMLDRYLRWMVTSRATDLHLSPGFPASIRVDRVLTSGVMAAPTDREVEAMIQNLLSGARRAEYEASQSVDLGYTVEGVGRFRISCFRHSHGPAISVRHIPEEVGTLDDLGLPQKLADLVDYPSGLVLFCGPTGSGKSTTQAALVRQINDNYSRHVVTLEDPIEYLHASRKSLVHQREIGEHAPSFARGLADALREDPDVILVGELRDRETITMALAAAETGHLVMGTLHVNTTASAITRLQHAFHELERPLARAQIAESLRAVVNQRLLPRSSDKGLVPIVELLRVNHAVSSLIRDDKLHQIKQVLPTGQNEGMITFERSAAVTHLAGLVSEDDARRVVPDRQAFDQMLALLRRESRPRIEPHLQGTLTARRGTGTSVGA